MNRTYQPPPPPPPLQLASSTVDAPYSFRSFSGFSCGEVSSVGPPWQQRTAHTCMCA